jgi:hypothetical protein
VFAQIHPVLTVVPDNKINPPAASYKQVSANQLAPSSVEINSNVLQTAGTVVVVVVVNL